jgi:hypothetical protein
MDPLKVAIFEEVRKHHDQAADLNDDQLNTLFFTQAAGLRLTYTGFLVLKNIFTVYSFELPITIKAKHQIGMSKMTYPYFFTKKRLILFSDMDAMTIKLFGGIEPFLENCINCVS